jgi:SAM-dependent methyltransferase
MLFVLGRLPGGTHLYRMVTRRYMGTQATHVDKLKRVWPGYVKVWRETCGLDMEGLDIWSHEGGWTPFPALAGYLLTGSGGATTNVEARLQPRYVAGAVDGALSTKVDAQEFPADRKQRIESLRATVDIPTLYASLGATLAESVHPSHIPLGDCSFDLCHSGGVLEHYRTDELQGFLRESYRVLRPGGVASHVFDHRDHLHHADRSLPFLAHLACSPSRYSLLFGHPLAYHSRLMPGQVEALFEDAGFQRIATRRMILPERVYVVGDEALRGAPGIERSRLDGMFRNATDADLRTAAAHYLFRKPAA